MEADDVTAGGNQRTRLGCSLEGGLGPDVVHALGESHGLNLAPGSGPVSSAPQPSVSKVTARARIPGVTSYYDLDAANDRVGEVRPLLTALRDDRDAIGAAQLRLKQLGAGGDDADQRAQLAKEQEQMTVIVRRMERTVRQIDAWGITLRDIGTGLVDFPALANGRPVWLCWKLGEGDIAWWHELDAGIAGRKPLIELE
ncbi:MAG: hypothetical protein DRQ55_17730 [Planctomycetota bacterium]|nr:MAG: hypothetical protein DRQ55_17730 [Planctomycetota bacterium]